MKDLTVNVALEDSEYLTAVRLVVGAVCATNGVDIDLSEDVKVCVTESCIILKNCGFDRACVTFSSIDGLEISVAGEGGDVHEGDNDFSLALIGALVSVCNIEKNGEVINKVILKV